MTSKTTAESQNDERTFNAQLARVKDIVELLEKGEVDLETGARLFREASESLKFCRERLSSVRNEIESLTGEMEQAEDFLARDQGGSA